MSLRIDQDHRRFREIVRGKIKQNLRKYITQGEMLGKKGKEVVSIPLPQIDIPHFRFGNKQTGGVGQGDGEPGDPLGQGQPQPGEGKAGDRPGEHLLEVDVTMEELAQILGEELQLPRPDEPPEVMRKRPWFNELTQDLLNRLETDAAAKGELPGIEKWRRPV